MQHHPNFHVSNYCLIGDWLGVSIAGPLDLVSLVQQGVGVDALDILQQRGCPAADMAWIIPASTLRRRRKAENALLTTLETARLLQWLRLRTAAEVVFGDAEKAQRWIVQPLSIFRGLSPLEIMKTGVGMELIDELLLQIDAGYFA